jgi:hypothetical protein
VISHRTRATASIVISLVFFASQAIPQPRSTPSTVFPVYEGYFCRGPDTPYGLTEDKRPMVCTKTEDFPHYHWHKP